MLGAGGSVNFFRFFRLPRVAFKCALSRCRASSTYLHCQSILRRKQQPGTRTFGAQADIAAGSRLSRLIQVTKSLQTRDWASDVFGKASKPISNTFADPSSQQRSTGPNREAKSLGHLDEFHRGELSFSPVLFTQPFLGVMAT